MGDEFKKANQKEKPLEHDAIDWELTEEPEIEPSELHPTLEFRPGGQLERDVHAEIDEAARRSIIEAQERGRQEEPEFETMREEWDEVSSREYEDFCAERDWDAYQNRLEDDRAERFNRESSEHDHEH
ncbi:hypothetical protein C5Y96_00020 [Blastopirellula marina]|uniref:Uncharacterized protein n=2 Tax=Pirellulales TaxID=2691354 RepID=A0A2S8GBG2_9BACT|nr:hypothetical protein C5Y96_00020 [Blastopirellula marina]RCS56347.1 hypothetical protein DTL36_00020 [Bremerella cremea]